MKRRDQIGLLTLIQTLLFILIFFFACIEAELWLLTITSCIGCALSGIVCGVANNEPCIQCDIWELNGDNYCKKCGTRLN